MTLNDLESLGQFSYVNLRHSSGPFCTGLDYKYSRQTI